MLIHIVAGDQGQVGSSLRKVLQTSTPLDEEVYGFDIEIYERDLSKVDWTEDGDEMVLHVTFPWSAEFTDNVHYLEENLGAALVVIHSTVPPGTCDLHHWVHSPVRGRHPNLVDGLTTFTKHFGGEKAAEAAYPFVIRGLTVQVHQRALETELGKLVELASFGAQVRIMHEVKKLCDSYGADFEQVYTAMTKTYNKGYTKLGEGQFVRPVLEFQPPPLGGHCTAQGTALLGDPFFTELVQPISHHSVKWSRHARKES